jgi:hypothetical protein
LPVTIVFKSGHPLFVTMAQKAARFAPPRVDRASLAAALGLKLADLHARLQLSRV